MKILNGYSFFDTVKNVIFLLYTKIFWPKARLVRLPILARNRANIHYGSGFTCGINCRLNPSSDGKLVIGDNVVMGDQCQIEAMKSVSIGNNVLIASRVYIGDANHGNYSDCEQSSQSSPKEPPNLRKVCAKPIVISDNVWIGNAAVILGGVSIGFGSIIGANAVVIRDIPEQCIAVGCPAKIIKAFDTVSNRWLPVSDRKDAKNYSNFRN